MADNRHCVRTPFRSRVKLVSAEIGEVMVYTRDLSDTGIYVFDDSGTLPVGSVVDVQIQDTPIEAPTIQMVVVRRDADGYGLSFVRE